jgi:prolyl oligopeptidase
MAARLQAATASGKPVLLRVEYAGGHGMGSTKTQREDQTADEWSFLLWQFGVPEFQPSAAAAAK